MFKNRSISSIVKEKVLIVNPKIKKLYKDQYSITEIAERMGVSTHKIKSALKATGITYFEKRKRKFQVKSKGKIEISLRNSVIKSLSDKNLSQKEIAIILGVSIPTVNQTLKRK
jgi:DNA-binding CsgD family transcriptional regulator